MIIADGRRPLSDLYTAFQQLVERFGWVVEVVSTQSVPDADGQLVEWPTLVFHTPQGGPALWVLSGIHGEEPAGPHALADNIELIGELGRQIPMVLFPLCNPVGYVKNWRYPNEPRDWRQGHSVGDSEYLLVRSSSLSAAESRQPTSPTARALTTKVLALTATHPPRLSIDHHEDEALSAAYLYSQGSAGAADPMAQRMIALLHQADVPIQMAGQTRFGETVTAGVIGPTPDGSVDELLAAQEIMVDGKIVTGPAARSVIVMETPALGMPLSARVAIHAQIIHAYAELWALSAQQW
jgi:hypothetical protein